MFDNSEDYTIAQLKKMISNYRQYHNIIVTKKKKQDLVNLLNEKIVLRNNMLYMKLRDGEKHLDRTDSYLLSGNAELLTRQIPERRGREGPKRQPARQPIARQPIARQPRQPARQPRQPRQPKKHRWDSKVQLERQRQRNALQRADNLLDEEPIVQPKVLKRLQRNQKSNLGIA